MRSDGKSRPFHTLRTEVSLRIFPLRPQRFAVHPAFLSKLTGTTARRKRTALPTHSPEHTDRHTPCLRQSPSTGKHFRNRPRTAPKNLRNGSVFDGRTGHRPVIKSVSPKPHFRRTRSGRQRRHTSRRNDKVPKEKPAAFPSALYYIVKTARTVNRPRFPISRPRHRCGASDAAATHRPQPLPPDGPY